MSGIINDSWTIDASGDWSNGANWYQVVPEPPPANSETLYVQPAITNDAEINPSGTTPFVVSYDEADTVNALDGNAYATLDLIGGTLTVANGGGWNGDFVNTGGTFDAATGWTAHGSTSLATGATDEVDSGVFSIGSGTLAGNLTGQGEFLLLGGNNFFLDPGFSITSGTLVLDVNGDGDGSSTTLGTDVDYAGTFLMGNSNGNPANLFLNGYTLTLSGTQNLNGYISGNGELALTGTAEIPGLQINNSVTVAVSGTVIQSGGLTTGNGTAPDNTVIDIETAGTWDITGDNQLNCYGDTTINNAGLFEKTAGSSYINLNANFTNASTGTIVIGGSLGSELNFLGSQSYFAGTITGPGYFYLGAGVDTLAAGAVVSNLAAFTVNNTQLTLEGSRTFSYAFTDQNSATVILENNDTFSSNFDENNGAVVDVNSNTLVLSGTAALDNSGVAGPGTLDLTNQATLAGFTGSDGLAVDILGTVDQAGYVQYGTGSADALQVSIAAGGVYDLTTNDSLNNSNSNDDGDATITNAGLLEKTAGSGTSSIYTDVVNTGTILVASGVLDLESVETSTLEGTITGAGELVLGRNSDLIDTAVLNVAALYDAAADTTLQENLTYAGTFTQGYGTLNLNGHVLTLSGTATLSAAFDGAVISGPGTLDLSNQATLAGFTGSDGLVVNILGTVNQESEVYYGNNSTDAIQVTIGAGAVYDLTNNSVINNSNTNDDGDATITNAGLLETTGTGRSAVYTDVVNTGTILVASGELDLESIETSTLDGTITGTGELFLGRNTDLIDTAVLNVAALYDAAADMTLQENLTYAGAFTQSGGVINLNGNNFAVTGAGSVRSDVDGGGTLVLGGAFSIGQQALGSGTEELVTGIAVQDGEIRLNYDGGTAASVLSIAAGGIYDITADQAIDNSGASAIINAGLFEKTGFNGNTIIFVNLTNAATGTISIEAGEELSLQANNNDLAGTVSGAYLNLAAGVTTLESALALDVAEIGLAANATLQLAGNQAYAGALDEAFGADLDLAGNNLTLSGEGSVPSYVYGGGTLNIAGTLALDGEGLASATDELITGTALQDQSGYDVRLDQDDGTASSVLSIAAGGTYDIIVNQWIDNDTRNDGLGTGTLINAGLLEKTGGAGAEDSVGTPGNSDIWTDFTNASTGTISVVSGTQISLRGETDDLAGTITGAGALLIGQGGTATLEAGLSIAAGSLIFSDSGTDVLLESDRTFGGAFTLQDGATIALNGYTFNLAGTSGLYADLQGPGLLNVSGNANVDGLYLSGGAELLDTGKITETGLLQLGTSATDSATLSIASNAVYDLLNDNGYGIGASGTVAIVNAGLFEKTGFTGTSTMGPAFTNTTSGTVAALSGVLAFAGSLDNDGLVTISGATLITNGTVGADTGDTGEFVLGPNAVMDETGGVAASQTIAMTGAGDELILGSGTTFQGEVTGFAPGDVIDLQGVTANGLLYANNILTLAENGNFVTSLAIAGITGPAALGLVYYGANGTDIVLGNAVSGSIAVDSWSAAGSGDFNNADNWSLSAAPGPLNVAAIFVGNNTGNDLVITDSQSSTIYALSDSDDSDTFLQTAGTLTVLDGGGYYVDNASQFDGALDQSAGAELVSGFGGAVIFYNGGTVAGTLAGAGNISFEATGPAANESVTLSASAALDVASLGIGDQGVGNNTLVLAGNIGYAGFLKVGNAGNFNGSYIDLQGYTLSLGGGAVFNSGNGGRLLGTGTVLLGGSATFIGYGIEDGVLLDVTGTLIDQNALDIGNADTDTSSISIASSGTFDLTADANVYGSNSGGIDGGVIYLAGLFEKTGDNGQSDVNNVNITQAANGILDVTNGILDINAGFGNGQDTYDYLAGTLEGAGEIEFNNLNVTFAPSVELDAAALVVNTANVTLTAGLVYGGALTTENGGGVALNGNNFTLDGTAALDGYVAGAGTLQVTGLADVNNLTVEQGALLLDAGTMTQDGNSQFNDTAAMSIASGAVFDIVNDSGISQQSGTITNAGLFEKTASTGVTRIFANYSQASTGTMVVAGGDVEFSGPHFAALNVVFAGTVSGGGEIEFDNNAAETENVTFAAGLALNIAVLGVYANTTLGGNLAYGGDLILNDNALDLNGQTLNLSGASSALDSGYLTGGGVLEVSGTATENGLNLDGGSELLVTGRVNQIGQLGFGGGDPYSSQPSNTLAIAAGGIYDLQNDSGLTAGNHGNETVTNAGLLEKTGDTGTSEISTTFSNTGTALATSGALQFDNITNLAAGTLTSGTYVADNRFIGAAIDFAAGKLVVDAADIILSGSGAEISSSNGNAYQAIESSLTEVTGTGTLAIIDGKNYDTANILTIDAGGVLDLASGTLAAAGLDFAPGPASLLVINAASELTGAVSGGGGTLGLAADSATGSFSTAMQSQFSNFGAIQIDAGAVWDFTGNFTLGAGTALLNNGTLAETGADALTISGAVTGAGLIILDPTTVTLNGSVAAGQDVSFANAGDVLSLGDPSQFNANITGFTVGDTIELAGVGFTGTGGAYGAAGEDTYTVATAGTLSIDADGTFYDLLIAGATIGQDNFILDGDLAITEAACFAAGTRIRTAGGVPRRVEALAVGDKIALLSGATAPVIWIGRRTLDLRRHPRPQAVQPVLITAGALGRGLPCRDLLVSPDHAMYLDGHLIPAKALLNGFSIRQLNRKRITYYHIELARHAVLFAEDAPAESYLETGNRAAFENAGPAIVLHPDFAQTLREAKGCAPFAESGPVVEAVRQRILDRAAIATTADPALQIRYEKGAAIIASRAAIPGEIFADPRDRRRLGVKIASLRVDGRDIPLDHPNLREGWHDREPDGRWTDGRAKIPLGLLGGSKNLQVSLAAALRYPLRPMGAVRPTKQASRAV